MRPIKTHLHNPYSIGLDMSRLWRDLSEEEQSKLDDNSPAEPVYDEEKEPSDSGEADGFDEPPF